MPGFRHLLAMATAKTFLRMFILVLALLRAAKPMSRSTDFFAAANRPVQSPVEITIQHLDDSNKRLCRGGFAQPAEFGCPWSPAENRSRRNLSSFSLSVTGDRIRHRENFVHRILGYRQKTGPLLQFWL